MTNNYIHNENVLLSILIINYNGKHYLGPCFNSIRQHLTVPYEIILVDNASQDGSIGYIQTYHPDVNLIISEKNLGFAAGNNLAARSAKGHYLLLLNNDTLILSDLKEALSLLKCNPNIGILSCKMIGHSNEYRLSVGHFPSPLRLFLFSTIFNRKGPFKDGNFPKKNNNTFYEVDWIEGSFILTRSEIWKSLNGMDDKYFMYGEDIDYCKRVKNMGFNVVYLPSLSYLHYGGYTSNRLGMLIKGFRRYHKKFSTVYTYLTAQCILTFGLMIRATAYYLLTIFYNKQFSQKTKACIKALKDSPW